MSPPELGLGLPLHGVQLIEASAGTGKTHTLATLYARLVLEARLEVGALLAVTYTIAATAELRERLRQRLQQALQRVEADEVAAEADTLLAAALAQEGRDALTARLRRAVAAMDVAPILTIHAFCQRALSDHALEAGQPLAARELVANEAALLLEVATEFWRQQSRDSVGARALEALARGPQALARTLRALLACDALQPDPPATPGDAAAEAELGSACERLAALYARHGADAREQLRAAAGSGAIHRTRSKDESVDAVWSTLAAWYEARDDALLHKNLVWFGRTELQAKWSAAKGPLPQSPLFDAIDAWRTATEACRAQRQREKLALLHRLRAFGAERLAQLKRERGLVGFDDLIAEVDAALAGPHGEAFAARLQAQYRIALVDEFQDTDLRQAGIFTRLFARPAPVDSGPPRALFLIGDPKQAIYRFRGGDVVAYLIAAHRADQRHALGHNFRSRPSALRALHALYGNAGSDAFAHAEIAFAPVLPALP
jgi:exodeoxyribonuclease V beta subunit